MTLSRTVSRPRKLIGSILIHLVLIIGAVVFVGPLLWVAKSSFTPRADIFAFPPHILPKVFTFSDYRDLLDQVPFFRNMLNSLVVAALFMTLSVAISSMAGFGFAKYPRAPGSKVLFAVMLASIMVPFQTLAISLFVNVAKMGWVNTYAALVIPLAANGFAGFMMTQFMRGFPSELLYSARIDGCSDFSAFILVVLPVMRPALAAVSVLQFVKSWNDFFWPMLVLNRQDMYTIPVMLGSFVVQQALVPYQIIVAGIVLATVPLIIAFLVAQKQFISGLTMGAFR